MAGPAVALTWRRVGWRLTVSSRGAKGLEVAFASGPGVVVGRPLVYVATMSPAPEFGPQFQNQLEQLFRWRRDVRHFRPDAVPEAELQRLLATVAWAPSVGLSQPTRLVRVASPKRRQAIIRCFEEENQRALAGYNGERREVYAKLKLSGLIDAPVHLAVYCDDETQVGSGLGQKTMPETRRYSVVAAIVNMWLMGRAMGIGLGWVSILSPKVVARVLDVPDAWTLVGYFCVGYPTESHDTPELERQGWERRRPEASEPLIR